jgi:hypothetical protein
LKEIGEEGVVSSYVSRLIRLAFYCPLSKLKATFFSKIRSAK